MLHYYKNLPLLRLKPPKYDAISINFGDKNLSFRMGVAGPAARRAPKKDPLVFPELLGRLNADPIMILVYHL